MPPGETDLSRSFRSSSSRQPRQTLDCHESRAARGAPPILLADLITFPRSGYGIVAAQTCTGEDPAHVRFGSKADIRSNKIDVRFTPKSGLAADILRISNGREVAHFASVLREPREKG